MLIPRTLITDLVQAITHITRFCRATQRRDALTLFSKIMRLIE